MTTETKSRTPEALEALVREAFALGEGRLREALEHLINVRCERRFGGRWNPKAWHYNDLDRAFAAAEDALRSRKTPLSRDAGPCAKCGCDQGDHFALTGTCHGCNAPRCDGYVHSSPVPPKEG